eukprot:6461694-Amphidinium_carterae.1
MSHHCHDAAPESTSSRKAVLINHGSFNPPHRGHIHMMSLARRRVEDAGYTVVAGIMAITNQSRLRQKRSKGLPDQFRVDLINVLAHEAGHSQWLWGDIRGTKYQFPGDVKRPINERVSAAHHLWSCCR